MYMTRICVECLETVDKLMYMKNERDVRELTDMTIHVVTQYLSSEINMNYRPFNDIEMIENKLLQISDEIKQFELLCSEYMDKSRTRIIQQMNAYDNMVPICEKDIAEMHTIYMKMYLETKNKMHENNNRNNANEKATTRMKALLLRHILKDIHTINIDRREAHKLALYNIDTLNSISRPAAGGANDRR